jgi:tRNA threonylcarbamoyladenosine dehydratase
MDRESFYGELTRRNRVLIGVELQERLRRQRFVIAGVGSTGGACVMPLVRSGAARLALVDPGAYELSNLNRQEARVCDVGRNKARVQAERALEVNPFLEVEVDERGIDASEPDRLLREGDLVIDAVDVTERAGLAAKLALHEACCRLRLRVITAYDVASTQYVELYDYARVRRPLRGRVGCGELEPLRALRALVPLHALPDEIFAVLEDRRRHPDDGWPQLAMTSALLGPLVVAYVLRLLDGRSVRRSVRLDVLDVVRPPAHRLLHRRRRDVHLVRALWQLHGS